MSEEPEPIEYCTKEKCPLPDFAKEFLSFPDHSCGHNVDGECHLRTAIDAELDRIRNLPKEEW
jgi:hypothetical protein